MKILPGVVIGELTVISEHSLRINGNKAWLCKCTCGTERIYRADTLKSRINKGCNCNIFYGKIKEGDVFSRLTVIRECPERTTKQLRLWECKCECGNITEVTGTNLNNGHTRSCGCLAKERASEVNTKHGMVGTGIYYSWSSMKDRCDNPKNKHYHNYGGRGIKYSAEFKDFSSFYSFMCSGWKEGLELERKNVNGNYTPDNCCWVTSKEQANNKRNTIKVNDPNTGEVTTLPYLADKYSVNLGTLRSRYDRGYRGMDLISSEKVGKEKPTVISKLIEEFK